MSSSTGTHTRCGTKVHSIRGLSVHQHWSAKPHHASVRQGPGQAQVPVTSDIAVRSPELGVGSRSNDHRGYVYRTAPAAHRVGEGSPGGARSVLARSTAPRTPSHLPA